MKFRLHYSIYGNNEFLPDQVSEKMFMCRIYSTGLPEAFQSFPEGINKFMECFFKSDF